MQCWYKANMKTFKWLFESSFWWAAGCGDQNWSAIIVMIKRSFWNVQAFQRLMLLRYFSVSDFPYVLRCFLINTLATQGLTRKISIVWMFVSFQRLFDWVLLFLFSFWSFWEILFSWKVSLFVCLSFVLMTDLPLMICLLLLTCFLLINFLL